MTDDQGTPTPESTGTPEPTGPSTEPGITPGPESTSSSEPPPPVEPAPSAAPAPAEDAPATTAPSTKARPAAGALKYGYYWGTGRRKSAIARVRLREGTGKFVVNKRELKVYFLIQKDLDTVLGPLVATEAGKRVDVFVNVGGGGVSGQAGAIVLGLARALLGFNADYEPTLRTGRYLTRDSRRVERKKYGQRGARRRFQFSKR